MIERQLEDSLSRSLSDLLDFVFAWQTVAPPRAHRNNHFDDDDEMLMKDAKTRVGESCGRMS